MSWSSRSSTAPENASARNSRNLHALPQNERKSCYIHLVARNLPFPPIMRPRDENIGGFFHFVAERKSKAGIPGRGETLR